MERFIQLYNATSTVKNAPFTINTIQMLQISFYKRILNQSEKRRKTQILLPSHVTTHNTLMKNICMQNNFRYNLLSS